MRDDVKITCVVLFKEPRSTIEITLRGYGMTQHFSFIHGCGVFGNQVWRWHFRTFIV